MGISDQFLYRSIKPCCGSKTGHEQKVTKNGRRHDVDYQDCTEYVVTKLCVLRLRIISRHLES